ncbi:NADH-ubiquinone oxidoreductase 21.3 kDa subunit [Geosmithia morbida]|uniref:NADH-ubiquinone oxidoreductase 21.3 kDa subunit n=1 Tax=Geosmithia morbida TaxID=1094350 RepID=A0A9P4YZM9_9HYPO|nr:NADH-ubiquinone oxidoreductase 21.3 kDa subunit [Geosmithia morbida]KAF4126006.1 NADH-ubiquinone oxidoreductase 21.3 kDa subunit [Geosmithia morbida]
MERQSTIRPKGLLVSGTTPYIPHDVISETTKAGVVGLLAGSFTGGVRNAMSRESLGISGFFIRQAPLVGIITAAPAAYIFVKGITQNLIGNEDPWGAGLGGFAAGGVLGLPFKRFAPMIACGTAFGVTQFLFTLLGARVDSFKAEEDEFLRKESVRRTTRVPIEETIAHIGEGRGVRAEGYEDRRRQLIKEKYGFEVNPVKATVDGSS